MTLSEEGRLEGILYVAGEAISASELADLLELRVESVYILLDELAAKLQADPNRGLEIRKIQDRYALALKPEGREVALRYFQPGKAQSLSSAAYETLAAVLYNQPVTRAQVEAVRGVNSDGIMTRLEELGYIENCGVLEQAGHPNIYRVSERFLLETGLSSTEDLPPMDLLMLENLRTLEGENEFFHHSD